MLTRSRRIKGGRVVHSADMIGNAFNRPDAVS